MLIPINIRIDFTPGVTPGRLTATVRYVGEDGRVFGDGSIYQVDPGQSISVGPLLMPMTLKAEVHATPATSSAKASTPAVR